MLGFGVTNPADGKGPGMVDPKVKQTMYKRY